MKRTIDHFLQDWKNRSNRKPLLLRGARQVGKTHAMRELGKTFQNFVEVNLDINKDARIIVEKDMDPKRIVLQLSELLQTTITPGATLLFFDEIQNTPKAINALRYFYELMPELHVVAAGSLLDFAIEQVGVPVGRVTSLYMYPLSFIEFLVALGHHEWAKLILERDLHEPMSDPLHEKLLELVGQYLAIGGMPEAVKEWVTTQTSRASKIVHLDLIYAYRQDFGKYAKKHQIKYLNLLFQKAIEQLSNKFMFSRVGEYKKRELEPALELLEKAGLLCKVTRSAGQGIPVGAQADLDDFKLIFLDVGLSQALLKLDIVPWLLNPLDTFINKGEIVEAFVGQEILAYADPIDKESLFYWRKDSRGSDAEIDYLLQIQDKIVPVEVKAGRSKRIKSMQLFLEAHPNSSYGVRFSADNYSIGSAGSSVSSSICHPELVSGSKSSNQQINSYPLYAVSKVFADVSEDVRNALLALLPVLQSYEPKAKSVGGSR